MNVLFICEHGSAKSVIAAAHFDRIARDQGLNAHASSRGTNPDDAFPPNVLAGLERDELVPLDDSPHQLTEDDFADATHVITFCDVTSPAESAAKIYSWEDVPAVSEGYDTARQEIVRRIERILSVM